MKVEGMDKERGLGHGIEAKEGDTARSRIAPEVIPMHWAVLIAAVGDDEEDAASGHRAEGLRDGSKSIPEVDGIGAVGSCLPGAMEQWE
jgi:hypothetical protein